MARKRRSYDQVPLPTSDKKDKPRYEDPFQKAVGKRIEEAAGRFHGHGRNILYGLAAVAVVLLVVWIIYTWSGRSNAEAQTALGKAIETSQAPISETPPVAGSAQKTFKTLRERADAAIIEFNTVAEKYGGTVGEKARYFAATQMLLVDRPAGIQQLQELSGKSGEVGSLAKFALAQTRAEDGNTDEAVALYQELARSSDPVLSKDTINFELAKLYEKQGRKDDAVNVLFDMVRAASEAKDADGKAIPLTATLQEAKEKLKQLDPEKAKEIPEPLPETPGGFPFGS